MSDAEVSDDGQSDEAAEEERPPEAVPNNPAGRLLRTVLRIRTLGTPKRPAADGWRAVLGLNGSGPADAELMEAFADVLRLPQQVRDAVASMGDPRMTETGLKHLPSIEQALQVQFGSQWNAVRGAVTEAAEHGLELLDIALSTRSREAELSGEVVDDLRSKVRTLIDDVVTADDLDDELRAFVLSRLEQIEQAVLRARIVGPEALREALNGALGAFVVMGAQGHDEPTGPTWAKVKDVLTGLALVLGIANAAYVLEANMWPEPPPPAAIEPARPETRTAASDDDVVDAEIVDEQPADEE